MKKKILSIVAEFAVMLSHLACQAGDMGQVFQASDTVSSTAVISETITQDATETTTNDNTYNYPAYPLPYGWTFERICGLVQIDGETIKSTCTDEVQQSI